MAHHAHPSVSWAGYEVVVIWFYRSVGFTVRVWSRRFAGLALGTACHK